MESDWVKGGRRLEERGMGQKVEDRRGEKWE